MHLHGNRPLVEVYATENAETELYDHAADLQAGSRCLKLFCATYGTPANAELLGMVEEFLTYMGDE